MGDYAVHIEEEYGYRQWLWMPEATVEELKKWWRELPTVAPFFYSGPANFPGEISQIYFHTRDSFQMVTEGDGRNLTAVSDLLTLPTDAIYMHIHDDSDSYMRHGEELIHHAGKVSEEEYYSDEYETPKKVEKAWEEATAEHLNKILKEYGTVEE
jgi:hypothetical protein